MENVKLEIINLNKIFFTKQFPNGLKVLDSINFEVYKGEVLSVVGPSGCGKTTLFNLISGLDNPTEGKIFLDGTEINGKIGLVGYMFQNDFLLPWRTVLENVTLGLEVQNKLNRKSTKIAKNFLEEYGLKGFENVYPKSLSGGMKQRVALIRTLMVDNEIILFDEPFGALDYDTRLELERDLLQIVKKRNKTAVFVTHNIDEAISISDRVLVFSKRPAKVKNEYNISLTMEHKDPIEARKAPEFSKYFSLIWDDFQV